MLKTYKPKLEDLTFRQQLLMDEETMAFNHGYGGTIAFTNDCFDGWYNKWLNADNRYYRYLVNEDNNFVGEIAYYLNDDHYEISIIILNKYRKLGYGKQGLALLVKQAKLNNIDCLYDDIAIDNISAYELLSKNGFKEIKRDNKTITMKYGI